MKKKTKPPITAVRVVGECDAPWKTWLERQTLTCAPEVSETRSPLLHIHCEAPPPSETTPCNAMERLAWSLASSGADALVRPVRLDPAPDIPGRVMSCERSLWRTIREHSFLALFSAECDEATSAAGPVEAVDALMRRNDGEVMLSTTPIFPEQAEQLPLVRAPSASLNARTPFRQILTLAWPLRVCLRDYGAHFTNMVRRRVRFLRKDSEALAYQRKWKPVCPRPKVVARGPAVDDRIHVLLAMHWLDLGGAEKWAVDIARGLDPERFAFHVVTDVPSLNRWEDRVRPHVEEVLHIPEFIDDRFPENREVFVEDFIRSRRIDILHIHHSATAYCSLMHLRRRFPQLTVMDSLHIIEMPTHNGGYPEWSGGAMTALIDVHHVISDHLRRFLVQRWRVPEERIRLIRLAADGAHYSRESSPRGALRKDLGIPDDALVVGFLGRMARQKRPELFLEMAEDLTRRWKADGRGEPLHFLMAGDGDDMEKIRRSAEKSSATVHLPGRLDDTRPFYADVDVIAMPSENEGIALVVYEAAKMGTPGVFTDVGGHDEIFPEEWLVDPEGEVASDMAERVFRLLLDPDLRARVAAEARDNLDAAVSDVDPLGEMARLYEEFAGRPSVKGAAT